MNRTSKSAQLAQTIRRQLLEAQAPGTRLPSMAALARRFEVSLSTVIAALSALEYEGVIERRHGSGTYLTDPVGKRHVALWVAIDVRTPQANYWTLRVLSEVQKQLTAQGIRVKAYWSLSEQPNENTGLVYEEFLQDLSRQAIVAVGGIQGAMGTAALKLIRQRQIPLVRSQLTTVPTEFGVGISMLDKMRQAARYLLQQGCRRIAWLDWFDPQTARLRQMQRQPDPLREVFREELAASGVALREEWLAGDLHPSWPGAGYDEFREIWAATKEKPDGLFVGDDLLLPDAVTAIRELGINVPGQLRVLATANKGAVTCPFFPAARMEFDPAAYGAAMGQMLGKLARGEPVLQRHVAVSFQWQLTGVADLPLGSERASAPAKNGKRQRSTQAQIFADAAGTEAKTTT